MPKVKLLKRLVRSIKSNVKIRAQRTRLWLSPERIQFLGIPMALGVMEYWSDGVYVSEIGENVKSGGGGRRS
jgi:hypothetical protein